LIKYCQVNLFGDKGAIMQSLVKILTFVIFIGFGFTNNISSGELLTLSDDYFDFGEIEIGDEYSDTLTIENNSNEQVIITDLDLWGAFLDFDYYSSCRGILEAGDACDIEIIFAPQGPGDLEASLEIEVNNRDTFEIYLEGTGVPEE